MVGGCIIFSERGGEATLFYDMFVGAGALLVSSAVAVSPRCTSAFGSAVSTRLPDSFDFVLRYLLCLQDFSQGDGGSEKGGVASRAFAHEGRVGFTLAYCASFSVSSSGVELLGEPWDDRGGSVVEFFPYGFAVDVVLYGVESEDV